MSLILQDILQFKNIDPDGDVEVEMSTGDDEVRVYINKIEIKELIIFLEEQLSEK